MAQAYNIATHWQDPMVPEDFNPYDAGGSAIVIDGTNVHLAEEAFGE